jgi:hypothetical protein
LKESKTMDRKITYSVLYSCPSVDDEIEMGAIDLPQAISLVSSFPFNDELKKREKDPELITVPTLSFHRWSDDCFFAVWSETFDELLIFCPTYGWMVDGVTDLEDVSESLKHYFRGDDQALADTFRTLIEKYDHRSEGRIMLPSGRPPNDSL